MRTLNLVIASSLLLTLSGCQHLHLMKTNSDSQIPAQSTPTSTQTTQAQPASPSTNPLHKLWGRYFGQEMIRDYPAACLAQSKLYQPIVVGQVIDTPRYAMVTLAKQQQPAELMGGELCIFNKINQHIEITAVDDLRFIAPSAHNQSIPAP